jgi:hypothetical protein
MSEPEWALGRIAYDAYLEASAGRSLVSGAELPHWDEQSPELRRAWAHVGEVVVRRYEAWRLP